MPVTTRKANADVHPGRIVLDNQQTKRTKKQIEDDLSRARAEDHAIQEQAKAKHRAIVDRIAQLEDAVALSEKDTRTHAHRPDLRVGPLRPPKVPRHASGSYEPSKPREDDKDSAASVDAEDRLEDDDPQTNTEGTGDFALPVSGDNDEGPGPALEDECDDNRDIHYSDEASAIPAHRPAKKRSTKKLAKKGNFRAEVTAAHKHASGIPNKRKTPPSAIHAAPKRVKEATTGGFVSNWREKTEHLRQPRSSMTLSQANTEREDDDNSHEGPYPPGEFDEDETEDVITQAKNKKTTIPKTAPLAAPRPTGSYVSGNKSTSTTRELGEKGPSRTTEQMGVKVRKVPIAMMKTGSKDPKQKSARKLRPTVSDLPLPRSGGYTHDWRKRFVPLLISWAGSQIDPFGTNGQIDGAVKSVWKRVYPDILLEDAELDIVVIVAENTVNNWRSGIGKAGYRAVIELWDSDPSAFGFSEDRAAYVATSFDNLRFLYKYPDETHGRGAFCSPLISKVFASHMRKISMGPVRHMPQVGGLALVAAAVEHGLSFFKSGEDVLKLERDPETGKAMPRTIRGVGFTDNLWGTKSHEFVKTTMRLKERHWDEIIEHTAKFMCIHALDTDDETHSNNVGDAETVSPNPRAVIDID